MRQAIVTKRLEPTEHRDARISARAAAGTKVYPWTDSLSHLHNHCDAAVRFADSKGWLLTDDYLAAGTLPDGSVCHVLVESSPKRTIRASELNW